jgi:phospholipid/cholesterol/gamma-HCH transport system permease protein
MIARAEGDQSSRFRLRRFLAAVGSRTIAGTQLLLLFVSLAATVVIVAARRSTWQGPVRTEFMRVLHGVAVRSLPTTVATGMLVGFALVTQAVYWLEQTGTTGLVGPVIVVLLIRELVPILIGLIVFGRSGTATLIELGEAQTKGWLRVLEIQGVDPLVLLVLPRAFGFAIGAFCLATVLLLTTLATGYLVAHALGLVAYSMWDFADLVVRAMKVQDFIFPPLKCITIGFVVALACCATGLGRRDESDELQRLVPRGFVRSALAILVVNSLFDLVG